MMQKRVTKEGRKAPGVEQQPGYRVGVIHMYTNIPKKQFQELCEPASWELTARVQEESRPRPRW